MASKRDYYEVLEIERTASDSEVSVAYRSMAIKFHPDKNPGDDEAVERFKEAAEAFEVLNDTDKRARYDRFGHAGIDGPGAGGSPHFQDVGDIFEAFGDIFGGGGGMFGDLFGGGRGGGDARDAVPMSRPRSPSICSKPHAELVRRSHSIATVRCETCDGSGAKDDSAVETCRYCGGRGQVVQSSGILRVQTTCPSCRGAGKVIKDHCPECRGEGYTPDEVEIKIAIPAGIDDGMRVRISGEGEPSTSGGPPGDCYCLVRVREHALFRREGNHLICRVPVSYSQAALGATLEIPTLDGREPMEIPSGTQPGEVFTMRRRGMPDPRNGAVGDLLVQINIDVPKKLDSQQENLIRDLAELEHANVTPHRKKFMERLKEFFVPEDQAAE